MRAHGRVLLLGATGFIGRHLLGALTEAGYDVTCGVRDPRRCPGPRCIAVDFASDHAETDWLSRLTGVDYIVNAVGILRESAAATFEALHVAAPIALFRAGAAARVRKIVQISALGADDAAASRYHLTKKRADDALAALDVDWVVVQPSLVFGEAGRSAAMFATLASLPVVPVPGRGDQRMQPVHIDDLTALVVRVLASDAYDRRRIAAVGPRELTLREYLAVLRRAMRLGEPWFVGVPPAFVRAAAAIGEKTSGALLDRESLAMLERGNVASPQVITSVLGRPPRAPEQFLDAHGARAAANEARLAWLLPLLRYAIAIVWIVTGIVSLGVYPVEASYDLLARVGLTGAVASIALYGAAVLDLAFGIGCLVLRRRLWLWRAQIALIAGYTAIISIFLPEFWLHPYGPLTKNLPMLAAILVLHEFDKRG
jgi:uncharacterized protein YbjT (DUF2867 family)